MKQFFKIVLEWRACQQQFVLERICVQNSEKLRRGGEEKRKEGEVSEVNLDTH